MLYNIVYNNNMHSNIENDQNFKHNVKAGVHLAILLQFYVDSSSGYSNILCIIAIKHEIVKDCPILLHILIQ